MPKALTCCAAMVFLLSVGRTASSQTVFWENRGQPEFGGIVITVDATDDVVVGAGFVQNTVGRTQWFVRAVDTRTGLTIWEDRYGPFARGGPGSRAVDVEIEGSRAFVSGWTGGNTFASGFTFVVRAYDLASGAVAWSHEVSVGPECGPERPGFGRCVAKAVEVHDGRVFAVGHMTVPAGGQSDFAVVALDANTGDRLWERGGGAGSLDAAWAVSADGDRVFVLGEQDLLHETDDFGVWLRCYDAKTGALHWERQFPGASNYTLKSSLVAGHKQVFIATDENAPGNFTVRALDGDSGDLIWIDRIDDGSRVGRAEALALEREHGSRRLFATGVRNCDPDTLFECTLVVRAYDPETGVIWERAEQARGGDWGFPTNVTAGKGGVFFGGSEILEDGAYYDQVRAFEPKTGALSWQVPFDEGGDPPGFLTTVTTLNGRLVVGGQVYRGPDFSSDILIRLYATKKKTKKK
jgi:outer membrane protein assembly factor BamB